MVQGKQRAIVGVALPDAIEGSNRKIDRPPGKAVAGTFNQHAVVKIAGVVKSKEQNPRPPSWP